MANNTWKIARRSNAQLPLVIVLALAVVLVLLGKAQSGLFDRARMRITDWMAPTLESVHAPVQAFNRWIGSVDELFVVYQENLALKDENARLKQWRNVAVVMQNRVRHYQQMLHAVPDPDVDTVLARVIGRASRPFLQTMILDAGESSNVKPGEAVVDARGMIGRIYLAGDHTSWVILLTDLNSRIPVTIASASGKTESLQAIMTGDNTAMPLLDTLSQSVSLRPGDQVVSSGDGGLLPPGLAIGTVVGDPGAYRVALLTDPASSEDVEVLAFRKPAEALPAASQSQLPAVAAGLPPAAPPQPAPAAPAPAHPAGTVSAQAQAPAARAPAAGDRDDSAVGAQDRARLMMGARLLSALLPVTCGLLGVLLSNLPVTLFGGLVPPPLLGFIPIYFWCLVRPDLMTPAAAFIIGILQDVMSGAPPGIWTLSFIVAYAVIQRQRDAFAGLAGVAAVLGFATATLIVCATAYFTIAVYYWHMAPLGPIVGELAITVLFYIPAAFVIGSLHRRLVGPLRSDF